MQELKFIRNEKDYMSALAEASFFVDNEPPKDSKEADRFEFLIKLIEAYEAKHYPVVTLNH